MNKILRDAVLIAHEKTYCSCCRCHRTRSHEGDRKDARRCAFEFVERLCKKRSEQAIDRKAEGLGFLPLIKEFIVLVEARAIAESRHS